MKKSLWLVRKLMTLSSQTWTKHPLYRIHWKSWNSVSVLNRWTNIAFRKISQNISSKLLFKIVDILMGLKIQLLKNCKKFQNIGQNGYFRFFVHKNVQANSLGSKLWTYSRNSRSLWCRLDDGITHCKRIYIQRFAGGLSSL